MAGSAGGIPSLGRQGLATAALPSVPDRAPWSAPSPRPRDGADARSLQGPREPAPAGSRRPVLPCLPSPRVISFGTMPVTKAQIEKNLRRIQTDIADACARKGRDPAEVSLVAGRFAARSDTARRLPGGGGALRGYRSFEFVAFFAGKKLDSVRARP